MATPSQIQAILAQRQPLADRLEQVELHLTTLEGRLRDLEHHRKELVAKVEDPQVRERLQSLNLTNLEKDVVAGKASLVKLKVRFSRNTLNIGVVGRARQGKSRLLQSLSGLSTAEIPTGDSDHCTGVKSIIYHRSQGEAYGEVVFYSEVELLHEVIYPYYDRLSLGSKPMTLKDFAQKPLPPLLDRATTTDQAMYEHLQRYHAHGETCRSLSGHYGLMRINQDQIREYVAQDTVDRQRVYFNYLAVREARIFCEFPNAEVGQVALIDMPGLGDTGLGDEERMIQTLGQDVDVVLFVRKPRAGGDAWGDVDVQLYDTARSSLPELPLEKWSFYVLNRTFGEEMGNNSRNCDDLRADMPTKHLAVVDAIVANCADPSEANEKVLDRVLDYLATEITHLDREYAQACQSEVLGLQQAIEVELLKAEKALGSAGQWIGFTAVEELFSDLFGDDRSGWWKGTLVAFQNLRHEFAKLSQLPSQRLERSIERVAQICREDGGILTTEDAESVIQQQILASNPMKAYGDYRDQLRTLLSNHFSRLDEGLKEEINHLKDKVAHLFISQGNLGLLVPDRAGAAFIQGLRELVEREHPDLKQLGLGLRVIESFDLSYNGLIEPQIYQHLLGFSNIQELQADSYEATLKPDQYTDASLIYEALSIDYDKTVARMVAALEELLIQPSLAAYARLEKFMDNALYHPQSYKEWQKFLRRVKGQVWVQEIGSLEAESQQQEAWKHSIDAVQASNQVKDLEILV